MDRLIKIATGQSRLSLNWENIELLWSEFKDKFKNPVMGKETQAEYFAMNKSEQARAKDVGGFVGGELKGGRRKAANVISRDLITLDLDNIGTGELETVVEKVKSLGYTFLLYTTRSHTEKAPRLRVVFPFKESITPEIYEPVARKLAERLGIMYCDPTTFEASRLMYWASSCKGAEYVNETGDGLFVDAEEVLAEYADWQDVSSWPRLPGEQAREKRLADKQQDPLTKEGTIGDFCRCYSIQDAIETFLPDVYEGGGDRWTYKDGHTKGGAVVYDDKFLYSHHATDPVSGELVNAFDLVRIHKFGEMDDNTAENVSTTKRPSFKAMIDFAIKDEKVKQYVYDTCRNAPDVFSPVEVEGKEEKPDILQTLQPKKNGKGYASTRNNIILLIEKDEDLSGAIAYDDFGERIMLTRVPPWDRGNNPKKKDGDLLDEPERWSDLDDSGLAWWLESHFDITGEKAISDSVRLVANMHRYNEVHDYLKQCHTEYKDAVKIGGYPIGGTNIDTMLIDFLGAKDCPYSRQVSRKFMVAAVARALKPGIKFDCAPVLCGPQGIGKSTLLKILGGKWFNDSLQSFDGKEAAELIRGTWVNELPEMTSYNKSTMESGKQFLSKTEDIYRAAYGKRAEIHKRACVFAGTTNNPEVLRDSTGNRRFWPIDVGVFTATKSVWDELPLMVNLLWGEAVEVYKEKVCKGKEKFIFYTKEERQLVEDQQLKHTEDDPLVGQIEAFIAMGVPEDYDDMTIGDRVAAFLAREKTGVLPDDWKPRTKICSMEVWHELLGERRKAKRYESNEITAAISKIKGWKKSGNTERCGPYGPQKVFKLIGR